MTRLARVARYAGGAGIVAAGVVVGHDVWQYLRGEYTVSQGGSPHGGVTSVLMGVRHLIGAGLANAWRPAAVWTVYDAERDARALEHELLQGGANKNGYDNGADAFRHAFGAALIGFRLVRDRGMSVDDAAAMMRQFGDAHEQDSFLTGVHRGYSRAMDLHNNEVGLRIGLELAARSDMTEATLRDAILDAIRGGEMVVLDSTTSPPRATHPGDLDLPQRDAPVGREPSGTPSFTTG